MTGGPRKPWVAGYPNLHFRLRIISISITWNFAPCAVMNDDRIAGGRRISPRTSTAIWKSLRTWLEGARLNIATVWAMARWIKPGDVQYMERREPAWRTVSSMRRRPRPRHFVSDLDVSGEARIAAGLRPEIFYRGRTKRGAGLRLLVFP